MIKIPKETIIEVCNRNSTMAKAAAELKIHFGTLKKFAILYGCYEPNQSGKGIKKDSANSNAISLQEILEGKHPSYQTYKLKLRLLSEQIFLNICSKCKIIDWEGELLNMELDHIDGDRTNHVLSNLRMLCPNCHAQTDTYRSKKRK